MSLRALVQAAIQAHPHDSEQAAFAVCKALEDRLDLQGNGWFDDDPVLLAALNAMENRGETIGRTAERQGLLSKR